jgi:hypothetical protein
LDWTLKRAEREAKSTTTTHCCSIAAVVGPVFLGMFGTDTWKRLDDDPIKGQSEVGSEQSAMGQCRRKKRRPQPNCQKAFVLLLLRVFQVFPILACSI